MSARRGAPAQRGRLQWIDLTRAIAIGMVMLCHAAERVYPLDVESMAAMGGASRLFALAAFSVGRLGVPLFLMISGYLLLDREYDDAGCASFWRNSWLRLVICTAAWVALYDVIFLLARGERIRIFDLAARLLYMKDLDGTGSMTHIWYMPLIISLYALIPFVANGLRSLSVKRLNFALALFFVILFCAPVLTAMLRALGFGEMQSQLSQGFSGGVYGYFLVLGYAAKKGVFKRIRSAHLLCAAALAQLALIGIQIFSYRHAYAYNVWYDNPALAVCAACLFELLSRAPCRAHAAALRFLARYAFAVYLIHNVIRAFLLDAVLALGCALPMKVMLMWAAMGAGSFAIAAALDRIPGVGRHLLYVK